VLYLLQHPAEPLLLVEVVGTGHPGQRHAAETQTVAVLLEAAAQTVAAVAPGDPLPIGGKYQSILKTLSGLIRIELSGAISPKLVRYTPLRGPVILVPQEADTRCVQARFSEDCVKFDSHCPLPFGEPKTQRPALFAGPLE